MQCRFKSLNVFLEEKHALSYYSQYHTFWFKKAYNFALDCSHFIASYSFLLFLYFSLFTQGSLARMYLNITNYIRCGDDDEFVNILPYCIWCKSFKVIILKIHCKTVFALIIHTSHPWLALNDIVRYGLFTPLNMK